MLDQFEEVLTLDPGDRPAKELFFDEMGRLLRDEKRLWSIFAIREDYLGELSPLAVRLPTRLSNLYRLTLLGPDAAAEAVMGPAERKRSSSTRKPRGSSWTTSGSCVTRPRTEP